MKIEKPSGVFAEIVAHSVAENSGKEIVTVKVKYGLIVHSEFLRHRQLSRGVKSNRAIPCATIRKEVLSNPYIPLVFGKNKRGMQSSEPMCFEGVGRALFKAARYPAVFFHYVLDKMGLHKQVCNRLLNPWQWVEETITATEWQNLYALRIHDAAQADVREVVECIKEVIDKNREFGVVQKLKPGEWHVPYVSTRRYKKDGELEYFDNDWTKLSVEDALVCSAARCARSSYNKHDGTSTTLSTDAPLFETLLKDSPKHASPVEHQATPMQVPYNEHWHTDGSVGWIEGVTHVDKMGNYWSGNFCGWVQYRQLIPNESVKG